MIWGWKTVCIKIGINDKENVSWEWKTWLTNDKPIKNDGGEYKDRTKTECDYRLTESKAKNEMNSKIEDE